MKHIEVSVAKRLALAADVQEQQLEEVLAKRRPKVGQKVTFIAALTPNGQPVKETVVVTQVLSNGAFLTESTQGKSAVERLSVKGLGTIRADYVRKNDPSAKRFAAYKKYL